jgi:signal transduction histidine kinase
MVVASSLLAIVVSAAFAILLVSIADLRDTDRLARHSEQVLAEANQLEKLALDIETGQRGFVITEDSRFLEPWDTATIAFPTEARSLERLVADNREQEARARRIREAGTSYIRDYSVPLVNAVRRGDASARGAAVTAEGKRRVDDLRGVFDDFIAAERRLSAAREDRSATVSRRAIVAAAIGVGGSILLILVFTGYLTRVIVQPIRRAALMADRLAGGDLRSRMPESGVGEIGALERSFNVMAHSLEQDRGELARLADEQAALLRVATLVAQAAPPAELFAAVTHEVGLLLPVDATSMSRYEPDGTVTMVAGWSRTGETGPVFPRLELGGKNLSTLVSETGRPARIDDYADSSGALAAALRQTGLRSGVGTPIIVEGRVWGVMIAASTSEQPLPPDTEARLTHFTDLVATAIANAESRADLAASRARIVDTADDTRRRIERDLHDGAQQRLVSLALELRAAQATVPSELGELEGELSRVAEGLAGVLEELRETARGIHPAILAEGGLGPALKTLARRSPIPVELDVGGEARLPERVEVAAYYVVSEALTNAAKHANASVVHVDVEPKDGSVRLSIRDDGVGGADPRQGSGLIGLGDRVEALGGKIEITSPPGSGTALLVTLPIEVHSSQPESDDKG